MKKETVYAFLNKKEQEVRRNKDEHLRKGLLEAIKECRMWVTRPWAEMDQPVAKKGESMEKEVEELNKKQLQAPHSEAEEARLNELATLYWEIYRPFWKKIWPT